MELEKKSPKAHEYLEDEKNETISRYVYFTNTFKTNNLGKLMHFFAFCTLFLALIELTSLQPDNVMQQILIALWVIGYLLLAIFFEVVALNCRVHD